MTQTQLDALRALINYAWDAERDDFAENPDARGGHIFRSIVELDNMLHETQSEAEDWLTDAERDSESHYQEVLP